MAREFKLSVVAPDRTVVEQSVQSLIAPAVEGYMGVLAGHVPMIVALKPGIVEYKDSGGQTKHVAIGGGFLEVSGESAIVLADSARLAHEIDVKEEEERLESARRALRGEATGMSQEEATLEVDLAISRIRAAKLG